MMVCGVTARGSAAEGALRWAPHVAPPSVLPDISPTRGEIGLRFRDFANWQRWRLAKPSNEEPISPLVGEMSGRTEGGAVEHQPSRRAKASRPLSRHHLLAPRAEIEFGHDRIV